MTSENICFQKKYLDFWALTFSIFFSWFIAQEKIEESHFLILHWRYIEAPTPPLLFYIDANIVKCYYMLLNLFLYAIISIYI